MKGLAVFFLFLIGLSSFGFALFEDRWYGNTIIINQISNVTGNATSGNATAVYYLFTPPYLYNSSLTVYFNASTMCHANGTNCLASGSSIYYTFIQPLYNDSSRNVRFNYSDTWTWILNNYTAATSYADTKDALVRASILTNGTADNLSMKDYVDRTFPDNTTVHKLINLSFFPDLADVNDSAAPTDDSFIFGDNAVWNEFPRPTSPLLKQRITYYPLRTPRTQWEQDSLTATPALAAVLLSGYNTNQYPINISYSGGVYSGLLFGLKSNNITWHDENQIDFNTQNASFSGKITVQDTLIVQNECGIAGGMLQFAEQAIVNNTYWAAGANEDSRGFEMPCDGTIMSWNAVCGTQGTWLNISLVKNAEKQLTIFLGATNYVGNQTYPNISFSKGDDIGILSEREEVSYANCKALMTVRFT